MRTYIPEQWRNNWFVGGPDVVDHSSRDQAVHSSPEDSSLIFDKYGATWKSFT